MLAFHIRKEYWAEAKNLVNRYSCLDIEIFKDNVIVVYNQHERCSLDNLCSIFSALCAWCFYVSGSTEEISKCLTDLQQLVNIVKRYKYAKA
jgi:hypothetical protein